jgi:hypothetical protein
MNQTGSFADLGFEPGVAQQFVESWALGVLQQRLARYRYLRLMLQYSRASKITFGSARISQVHPSEAAASGGTVISITLSGLVEAQVSGTRFMVYIGGPGSWIECSDAALDVGGTAIKATVPAGSGHSLTIKVSQQQGSPLNADNYPVILQLSTAHM